MKPRPQSGTGPAVPGATTSEMAPESSLDNGVMLLVEKMTSLQGQIEELEKQCGKANTYAAELKESMAVCEAATSKRLSIQAEAHAREVQAKDSTISAKDRTIAALRGELTARAAPASPFCGGSPDSMKTPGPRTPGPRSPVLWPPGYDGPVDKTTCIPLRPSKEVDMFPSTSRQSELEGRLLERAKQMRERREEILQDFWRGTTTVTHSPQVA